MTADTVRILRSAREMLTPPGSWRQGGVGRAGEPHCIFGAIFEAAGPRNHAMAVRAGRLVLQGIKTWGTLEDWNDAPGRTHAEVLAVLDRAIAHAEGL